MSDNLYYHEKNPVIHLRTWVFGQMVWGAFIAGVVLAVIGVVLAAIWAVGLLLPAESKQAPSPYPNASIEQPLIRHLA